MSVSRDSNEVDVLMDIFEASSNVCFGSHDHILKRGKKDGATYHSSSASDDVTPLDEPQHPLSTAKKRGPSKPSSASSSPCPSNDLSEALMAGHGEEEGNNDHRHNGSTSTKVLLGFSKPKVLLKRLKRLNLREKLEVTLWNRSFWPVLPLFVKAEMNPVLTIVEEVTTWIVLISWLQIVLLGNVTSVVVGGIALFVSLSILHYWYGFTRYHSFEGDWYNATLTGQALDETFEELRDICSSQCHGDDMRRSQTKTILVTSPFTVLNYAATFPVYLLYKGFQLIRGGGRGVRERRSEWWSSSSSTTVPMMMGVFISNTFLVILWTMGGPFLTTCSVVVLIVNQRLYNALLFRRSWEGFVVSFVFGNFCFGETVSSSTTTTAAADVPTPFGVDETTVNVVGHGCRDVEGIIESPVTSVNTKRNLTATVKKTLRWLSTKPTENWISSSQTEGATNQTTFTSTTGTVVVSPPPENQEQLLPITGNQDDDIELGQLSVRVASPTPLVDDKSTIGRCDSLFDDLLVEGSVSELTGEGTRVLEEDLQAWSVPHPFTLPPSKKDTPRKNVRPLNRSVQVSCARLERPLKQVDQPVEQEEREQFDLLHEEFDEELALDINVIGNVNVNGNVIDKDKNEETSELQSFDSDYTIATDTMRIHVFTNDIDSDPLSTLPCECESPDAFTESRGRSLELASATTSATTVPAFSSFQDTLPSIVNSSGNEPNSNHSHFRISNDVYIHIHDGLEDTRDQETESNPGTVTWNQTIHDATVRFNRSTFTDVHYRWILTQLGPRDFFVGSPRYGWTKLNSVQVNQKCREAYGAALLLTIESSKSIEHQGLEGLTLLNTVFYSHHEESVERKKIQESEFSLVPQKSPVSSSMIFSLKKRKEKSKNSHKEQQIQKSVDISDVVDVIDVKRSTKQSDVVISKECKIPIDTNNVVYAEPSHLKNVENNSQLFIKKEDLRDDVATSTKSERQTRIIEPVDESIEVSDVINVSFLPAIKGGNDAHPHEFMGDMDSFNCANEQRQVLQPMNESIEISDVMTAFSLSPKMSNDTSEADRNILDQKNDVLKPNKSEKRKQTVVLLDESVEISDLAHFETFSPSTVGEYSNGSFKEMNIQDEVSTYSKTKGQIQMFKAINESVEISDMISAKTFSPVTANESLRDGAIERIESDHDSETHGESIEISDVMRINSFPPKTVTFEGVIVIEKERDQNDDPTGESIEISDLISVNSFSPTTKQEMSGSGTMENKPKNQQVEVSGQSIDNSKRIGANSFTPRRMRDALRRGIVRMKREDQNVNPTVKSSTEIADIIKVDSFAPIIAKETFGEEAINKQGSDEIIETTGESIEIVDVIKVSPISPRTVANALAAMKRQNQNIEPTSESIEISDVISVLSIDGKETKPTDQKSEPKVQSLEISDTLSVRGRLKSSTDKTAEPIVLNSSNVVAETIQTSDILDESLEISDEVYLGSLSSKAPEEEAMYSSDEKSLHCQVEQSSHVEEQPHIVQQDFESVEVSDVLNLDEIMPAKEETSTDRCTDKTFFRDFVVKPKKVIRLIKTKIDRTNQPIESSDLIVEESIPATYASGNLEQNTKQQHDNVAIVDIDETFHQSEIGDESFETSNLSNVDSFSQSKVKAMEGTKRDKKSDLEERSNDESVEVSEDIEIKKQCKKWPKQVPPEGGQPTKKKGKTMLGGVLQRKAGSEDETKSETVSYHEKEQQNKDNRVTAKNDREKKRKQIPRLALLSSKRSIQGDGHNARPEDSVEHPRTLDLDTESTVMWTESQDEILDFASQKEESDLGTRMFAVDKAMDYLGEMLCLDVQNNQKSRLGFAPSEVTIDDGRMTLDCRDFAVSEMCIGEDAREMESQEDIIEPTTAQDPDFVPVPKSKKTRKLGFKKFLSRRRPKNGPVKIKKLDEESKNDPELVKEWIMDQTRAQRNRSKLFRSVWTRALKLRQKSWVKKERANRQGDLITNQLDENESIEDHNSVHPVVDTKALFQVLFDSTFFEQQEPPRKHQEDAEMTKPNFMEEMFRDHVVWVWLQDYLKATPSLRHLGALADDISVDESRCSTISTAGSIISRIQARRLLEFVETKIEEDILFSRLCVGDSVYSGLQCDGGLAYLKQNDPSGFLTDFIEGDDFCGIDQAVEAASTYANRFLKSPIMAAYR